jgi:hypothetical protein
VPLKPMLLLDMLKPLLEVIIKAIFGLAIFCQTDVGLYVTLDMASM